MKDSTVTTYQTKAEVAHLLSIVIGLSIMFVVPELLFSYSISSTSWVMEFVRPVMYIMLFLVNYYVLIEKLFIDRPVRKRIVFIALNLLLFVIAMTLMELLRSFEHVHCTDIGAHPAHDVKHGVNIGYVSMLTRDFVILVLTIGFAMAFRLKQKWSTLTAQKHEMEMEQRSMELKNLRSQLNPHFLFNTLNNIYALIGLSKEKAQKAVLELSQLLRYVLYENQDDTVMLENELKFVNNYIELMRLRLNSLVTLKVNVNEKQGADLKIAPLLFIPLVENAFKHGVSGDKQSLIDISIVVENRSNVVCRVANSYFPKGDNDKSGSGIGVANLRKQLSIIYPDCHTFHVECDGSTYVTTLTIDLTQR